MATLRSQSPQFPSLDEKPHISSFEQNIISFGGHESRSRGFVRLNLSDIKISSPTFTEAFAKASAAIAGQLPTEMHR